MSCVCDQSAGVPLWHNEDEYAHPSDSESTATDLSLSDELTSDSSCEVSLPSFDSGQISPQISLKGRKRRKYSYDSNMTFSWKADPDKIERRPDNSINVLPFASMIQQHAYQRLQIFYTQALAYHRTGAHVHIVRTSLQHGSSAVMGMSAAHSCLLPGLEDTLQIAAESVAISDERRQKHLRHIMNVTVEMPHIVNEYDVLIEAKMRPFALSLLNQCSKKGLHPYEALELLVDEMTDFLEEGHSATIEKILFLEKVITVYSDLIDSLKTERFSEVCRHLLKLGKTIGKECSDSKSTFNLHIKGKFSLLTPLFELLNPYFRDSRKILDNLTTRQQFCNAAKNLRRTFSQFPAGEENPLELLDVTSKMKLSKLRKRIDLFLKRVDVTNLLPDLDAVKESLRRLSENLSEDAISLVKVELERDLIRFYDTLTVIKMQSEGTEPPPLCFLSGTKRNGKLKAMSDKELVAQQKELHAALVAI